MDPDLGRALHVRHRRHRAGHARADRGVRAAGHPLLLARGAGGDRPAGEAFGARVLRAAAGARDHDDRRLRRRRRVPLLRLLRGHARPDVLPHRLVRRVAPPVRGGEVLPLLPRRRPVHARRCHRPVGARRAHLRLGDADLGRVLRRRRALAVPRLLPRLRHQGAVLPVPHLAARRRWCRSGRRRGAARRRARQGRYVRHPAVLPAAVPERVRLLCAAGDRAGAGRHHLRRPAGGRPERPETAGVLHIGGALRLHRRRHLRLHHPGRLGRGALHGQPRPRHRTAVPGRRHAGDPPRLGSGDGLRRRRQAGAGARRRAPLRRSGLARAARYRAVRQ